MKYAPIFRRIVAYLIDCVLVFVVFVTALQFVILIPIRNLLFNSDIWFRSGWNTEIYTLLTISLPIWLYFIFCEFSPWQATVGKHLLKMRTLDIATNQKVSLKQAIVRTVIKLLPWELAHFTNNIPIPMWYYDIVLNRKRGLSLEMIRRLHNGLGIPAGLIMGKHTHNSTLTYPVRTEPHVRG